MNKLYIKALQAVVCLVLASVLCLLVFWMVQKSASWAVAVVAVLLAICCSSVYIVSKTNLKKNVLAMVVAFAGQLLPVVLAALCCVWQFPKHFEVDASIVFVAASALFTCVVAQSGSAALSVYFAQITYHDELYYYLLGNGHSHHFAQLYIQKRALERAALPVLKGVGRSLLGLTPALLFALVMTGVTVFKSVCIWVGLLLLSLCCAVLATYIILWLVRRYLFDNYGRLRQDIFKKKSA